MKKVVFRKIVTFSAVIALAISLLPVQPLSNAVKADEGLQQYISSSNEEPLLTLTNEKRERVLPYYFDEDYDGYYEIPGKGEAPVVDPSISYTEARDQLVNNPFLNLRGRIDDSYDFNIPKAYPAAYNDTNNLYAYLKNELTPLRNQGTEGCCWAVSTLGAVENYILTNGKKDLNGSASVKATDLIPGINYSEIQLAYFYYHNNIFNNLPEDHIQNDDVLEYYSDEAFTDIGGNYLFASQILTNGIGTVDESVIPYNTIDSFRTADQKSARTGIDDEFMVNNDVAHVNNAYYMNIHQNANQVKQAIKQNHAVSVSIRAEGKYYNSDYNTYYYSKRTSSINHALCIVGWDDSFPKEYFIEADGNGTTPTRDGAWLARNSWMDTLGPFDKDVFDFNGYFWISYEDNSLASYAFVFEADTSEDYDNVYSYTSNIHQTESFVNTYTVANVFKVNGEKAAEQECIYAVTLEIENENMDYEIYVYSVDEEGNPNEAISEPTTGRMVFPGIYTIPLSDPVVLQRGEEYAIVVTTGNYTVCIESCIDFSDEFNVKVGKNKGESFIFDDEENTWYDLTEYSELDEYGNFCISVKTQNVGAEEYPAVEGLKVTGRTEDSITLEWDEYPGAESYWILCSMDDVSAYRGSIEDDGLFSGYVILSEVKSTTFTDSDLAPNSQYVYTVIALDEDKKPIGCNSRFIGAGVKAVDEPGWTTEVFTTDFEIDDGVFTIDGYAEEGLDYVIYYRPMGEEDVQYCHPYIEHYIMDEEIVPVWEMPKSYFNPGQYEFWVYPYKVNLYGKIIYGSWEYDKFIVRYPAPTGLSAIYSGDNGTITLSWNEVEGAPGYRVYYCDEEYNEYICGTCGAGETSLVIDRIPCGDDEYMDIQDGMQYGFYLLVYDPNIKDDSGINMDPCDYSIESGITVFTYLAPFKFVVTFEEGIYDGSPYSATVTPNAKIPEGDIGEITVYYAPEGTTDWSTEAPVNAGNYIIAIDTEDGNAYKGVSKLTDESWTFTIDKAYVTVTPDEEQWKEDGDPDPIISYTWVSEVDTEVPCFEGNLSRTEGEACGEYEISIGSLKLVDGDSFHADNYELILNADGIFSIEPVNELDNIVLSADSTPTTIELTWNEVPKAKGYAIFLGDETEVFCTTKMMSYKFEGLTPDTEYSFTVYPFRYDNLTQYPDAAGAINVKTDILGNLSAEDFIFIPDEITYDKKTHGAKFVSNVKEITADDIKVYYKHGDEGWTETVPVNAGVYEVAIDVAATNNYLGIEKLTDNSWSYSIGQKEVGLEWGETSFVYGDGAKLPDVSVNGIFEGDICTPTVTGEASEAGTAYIATVTELSNSNYKLPLKPYVAFAIYKGEQVAPDVPKVEKLLSTGITIQKVNGYEYRMDNGEWQSSNEFYGLEQGREYTFYQRIAADKNHNCSESSLPLVITVPVHTHEWKFVADGSKITATCENSDKGHEGELTQSISLIKPLHEAYGDEKSEFATIDGYIDVINLPEIEYYYGTTKLNAAPIEPGDYSASINIEGEIASITYVIKEALIIGEVPASETPAPEETPTSQETPTSEKTPTSQETPTPQTSQTEYIYVYVPQEAVSNTNNGNQEKTDAKTDNNTVKEDSGTKTDSGDNLSNSDKDTVDKPEVSDKVTTTTSITKKGTKITTTIQESDEGIKSTNVLKEYKSGKKDITFLDFVDGIIANTTINKNGTSVITRFSLNKAEGNENVDSVDSVGIIEFVTTSNTVRIPDTTTGFNKTFKVTDIADNLFRKNSGIVKAYIGVNVETIGEKAFYKAKNLKDIYIYSDKINDVDPKAFAGIDSNAVFYIRADKKTYKKIVKLIKNSGVSKTVKFKRLKVGTKT